MTTNTVDVAVARRRIHAGFYRMRPGSSASAVTMAGWAFAGRQFATPQSAAGAVARIVRGMLDDGELVRGKLGYVRVEPEPAPIE